MLALSKNLGVIRHVQEKIMIESVEFFGASPTFSKKKRNQKKKKKNMVFQKIM